MARWRVLKDSNNRRCDLMWDFVIDVPNWLGREVSAWIGREAQADIMYCGSASSHNTHQADRCAHVIHPLFICPIGIGALHPVAVVFA